MTPIDIGGDCRQFDLFSAEVRMVDVLGHKPDHPPRWERIFIAASIGAGETIPVVVTSPDLLSPSLVETPPILESIRG